MKTSISSILISTLFVSFAHAGWLGDSIGNFGRAVGDVASLGQAGRDRDREFAQKQEEIARMTRENLLAQRDGTIKSLQNSIQQSTSARDNAIKVKEKNAEILNSMSYILDVFTKQIAGTYRLEANAKAAKVSKEQLRKDLDVLKVFLNQITSKNGQAEATALLLHVASSRNLSGTQFIEQTLAQSQFNKNALIKLTRDLNGAYPRYVKFNEEQDNYIRSEQEKINSYSAQLAAIHAAIQQEIDSARLAAEQAKAAADAAAAAARPEPTPSYERRYNPRYF
jgi:hypothetical protein